MKNAFGLLSLTLLALACDGARILAVIPLNSRSHFIVMEPLLQELAARGHQLTVVSTLPQKTPIANFTDIEFSQLFPVMTDTFTLDRIKNAMPNPWITTHFMYEATYQQCILLKQPRVKALFENEHFDLVITELFATDCCSYVAYKLKIPHIAFTTSVAVPWAAERVGFPDNPSYIPSYLFDTAPPLSLADRLYNTVLLIYAKLWYQFYYYHKVHQDSEALFEESLPPVHDVILNTSLLFVNSYHSMVQSRPFPPNVIEVGGIHIKKRQPLPKDIQQVLDENKNGVIIMSFGSLVKSSSLPKYIINSFMAALSKIPQTVYFKYEEDLPSAPPNVIIKKWLPQRDMIEHENVVAVILHGGLASTIEAVQFGKPLIGIPFFADQYANINRVASKNGAIMMDLDTLTEEKITLALSEVLNNTKYKDAMRRLSHQFRDRPLSALDTAVFWTEYVIRHKGAPHLQPLSVKLPLYQYLLLDVSAILIGATAVLIYLLYFTVRFIVFRFVFSEKKAVKDQKKKK